MRKLETVTGQLVNLADPDPATINIEDIAWGLSRMSRFCGQTVTAIPPTVAQHCIFVSDLIFDAHSNNELALIGLLHDAAETYIGDIPSPVKHTDEVEKVIKKIEDRLLFCINEKFLGRQPTEQEQKICHYFDKKAQFIEAYHFMHSRGQHWPGKEDHPISLRDLQDYPEILTSTRAYEDFLTKFALLSKTQSSNNQP